MKLQWQSSIDKVLDCNTFSNNNHKSNILKDSYYLIPHSSPFIVHLKAYSMQGAYVEYQTSTYYQDLTNFIAKPASIYQLEASMNMYFLHQMVSNKKYPVVK